AERRFEALGPELAAAEAEWASGLKASGPFDWAPEESLAAHLPLDGETTGLGGGRFRGGEPAFADGRLGRAAGVGGSRYLDAGDVGPFGFDDRFTLAAWVNPADGRGGTVVSRMTDAAQGDGYAVVLRDGRVAVDLVKRWLDDALRVETERAVV